MVEQKNTYVYYYHYAYMYCGLELHLLSLTTRSFYELSVFNPHGTTRGHCCLQKINSWFIYTPVITNDFGSGPIRSVQVCKLVGKAVLATHS